MLAVNRLHDRGEIYPEIVDLLLSRNDLKLNLQNKNRIIKIFFLNETPIMRAVEYQSLKVYKTIADKEGIDFNIQNIDGQTILHIAVNSENKELINEIVNNEKVDFNIKNSNLKTPLHLAIEHRNKYLANLLIKHKKTDLNITDGEGLTPLMKSIISIDDGYYRRMFKDSEFSFYENVTLLLISDGRTEINKKDRKISNHIFIAYNILNSIFFLNNNFLHLACIKQKEKIVEALISKGVNINDKNILKYDNFNNDGISFI